MISLLRQDFRSSFVDLVIVVEQMDEPYRTVVVCVLVVDAPRAPFGLEDPSIRSVWEVSHQFSPGIGGSLAQKVT